MNEKILTFFHKVKAWFSNGKLKKIFRMTADVSWNVLLIFIILGVIGGFFLGGIGLGYFASLVKDETIRPKEVMAQNIYNYEETTEIYFADNIYLGKLSADLHREEVSIKDVSPYVIDAVIATEDEYFHEHKGVVPKAIFRALFQEFTNSATKSGGSTLTQQLIKNQILTNEVSFERKAKEILLALRLEQFFEKDEILEAYLNVVPFGRDSSGRNIAGIQTAAQGVFGLNADELNLPQAAFLAGLPQSPFGYTPFKNGGELKSEEGLEPGLKRMKIVLDRMLETGKINQDDYEYAINYDIVADFIDPIPSPTEEYPWLTAEIERRAVPIIAEMLALDAGYTKEDFEKSEDLQEEYEILAKRDIRQKGYNIHTTIDKEVYDKWQEIAQNFEEYTPDFTVFRTDPETGEKVTIENPVQPGAILIENKTGRIISFVAGRDFEISENNHATYTKRPNGSTMKPLVVYAPALEAGTLQPATPFADVKNGGPDNLANWLPDNYTQREYGIVDARTALANSYNITATRAYKEILPTRPATYLDKMGFTSLVETEQSSDYENPSLGIGSLTVGVTVEENTNAFATFGNMGKFVDAYMIERIETKDGEVVYEHEPEEVEVFSPQTAYITIDMMRDVIRRGTATYLNSALDPKFRHVDWAGKTGSTENIQDTWFVATNPNVTLGSWMGYDTYDADGDGRPDEHIRLTYNAQSNLGYSNRNVLLWARLANAASEIRPDIMVPEQGFQNPGGLVTRSVCAVSGLLPSEACQKAGLIRTDIFNAKFVPTEVDYSLLEGNYVIINEKRYVAPEGTPEEFVEEGFILNPEFLKDKGWDKVHDLRKLLPDNEAWQKILIPETEELADDGKAPSAPTNVTISGNTLSWNAPPEGDVIGYHIYSASEPGDEAQLVGSTKEREFTLPAKDLAYFVQAVDYFGQQSELSEGAVHGDISQDIGSVTNLSADTNNNAIVLTWKNPTSKDFSHVKIVRNGTTIANNVRGQNYQDRSVQLNTSYTYQVIPVDKDGNEGKGASITVTLEDNSDPSNGDTSPPNDVTNATISNVSSNRAEISFNRITDRNIEGVNIYNENILIDTVNPRSGRIILSNLSPDTTYTIILKTINRNGIESSGVTVSFTTEADSNEE